jgi:hypothetical protein
MPFFVIALLLIYERKNLQKIASLKKEAVV